MFHVPSSQVFWSLSPGQLHSILLKSTVLYYIPIISCSNTTALVKSSTGYQLYQLHLPPIGSIKPSLIALKSLNSIETHTIWTCLYTLQLAYHETDPLKSLKKPGTSWAKILQLSSPIPQLRAARQASAIPAPRSVAPAIDATIAAQSCKGTAGALDLLNLAGVPMEKPVKTERNHEKTIGRPSENHRKMAI